MAFANGVSDGSITLSHSSAIARLAFASEPHIHTVAKMPKLDGTHLVSRLRERLEDLKNDKEVAARDLRALLTDEQAAEMDAAWGEQQALRKHKRARTEAEAAALGWKTKRQIHIEAYERAIAAVDEDMVQTFDDLLRAAEVRRARIYLESYSKAIEEGKPKYVAENLANNDLTRAGLHRLNGQEDGYRSTRDRAVRQMERELEEQAQSALSAEDAEQRAILEEHEKALRERRKKPGR